MSVERQLALLQHLPRAPRKTDAGSLHRILRNEGIDVTMRTVQRDLDDLSKRFALQVDDRSKPFGYSWPVNARGLDIPAMDGPTALTLVMIGQYLAPMLPPAVTDHLAPSIARAREILRQPGPDGLRRWQEVVKTAPRGQRLLPASIRPEVLRTVYAALFRKRRFEARYVPRGKAKAIYRVNPLGLVLRDGVLDLVVTLWDYDDVLQLALHRIESATLTDQPARAPKDFSLDKYVSEGHFDFPVDGGKTIKLVARFWREAAFHLGETPLSADQTIDDDGDEYVRITASVPDTAQLRWWLLAFGGQVEVIKPAGLRKDIATAVETASRLYGERTYNALRRKMR